MIPVACVLVVLFAGYGTKGQSVVGMNWGRESIQRLVPSQVVDLMLQNGIGNARVYTSQQDILEAFAGSGINLTVGIFNQLNIKTIDDARDYVKQRMQFFIPSRIRAVYLGVYIFDTTHDKAYIASSLKALYYIQRALNESLPGRDVKANFVHYYMALKPNVTKPSEAEFRDEIKEQMIEFLEFISKNDAPFVIETNNFQESLNTGIPDITFAFPDGKSNTVIKDTNGFVYTNAIEWKIDCFLWALSKVNASNVKIVVSMIGWPTDGYIGASLTNAEHFYKVFLPWVRNNNGTPVRPGVPIDFYAHTLTDENQNPVPFTRHWGIYRSNGMPKFKIDLTGQDRDMYPVTLKGIMQMPRRWCIFKGDRHNLDEAYRLFYWACERADCSSVLSKEGSCSHLNFVQNVSYAFNMYFQSQFQDESTCDLEGLAVLIDEDPSTENCVFPVEVVKGQQSNYATPTLFNVYGG